jgi:hypothetical protein
VVSVAREAPCNFAVRNSSDCLPYVLCFAVLHVGVARRSAIVQGFDYRECDGGQAVNRVL